MRKAPRAWNEKLNQILEKLKFVKGLKEPSLYRRQVKEAVLMVAMYIDDFLVTGSDFLLIFEFKKEMSANFEMSDLGLLTYYIGIKSLNTNKD